MDETVSSIHVVRLWEDQVYEEQTCPIFRKRQYPSRNTYDGTKAYLWVGAMRIKVTVRRWLDQGGAGVRSRARLRRSAAIDDEDEHKCLWAEEMGIVTTHISQGIDKNQCNIEFLISTIVETLG